MQWKDKAVSHRLGRHDHQLLQQPGGWGAELGGRTDENVLDHSLVADAARVHRHAQRAAMYHLIYHNPR